MGKASWQPSESDLVCQSIGCILASETGSDARAGLSSGTQTRAFEYLLDSGGDLIVAAATAEGKTEAVWLPIISRLATQRAASAQALYVGPLKALINDQFGRFGSLCRNLEIPVHRWHGDVDAYRKKAFRKRPGGIVLITPESLESNFINYGRRVPDLYQDLEFVVIDELHCFLETERGIHLRSLLSRLFLAIGRTPRLIGLSATIGHPGAAQRFLRPDDPDAVAVIEGPKGERCVQIAVHGRTFDRSDGDALTAIADDLAMRCRDSTNLVFANSRQAVEGLASHLASNATHKGQQVLVHHGSLAKRLREHVEAKLKSGQPVTAICTSSLELGIDIGSVARVFQIDPPNAVSALLQRLGRSGRRAGESAVLHLYTRDHEQGERMSVQLYPELLRGIATVELMLSGWLEPSNIDLLHLTTLVHQILSLLKETGGGEALELHRILCCSGPFRRVTPQIICQVLRDIARFDLVKQLPDSELILGLAGEKIVNASRFYAAFDTPRGFMVQHQELAIGTISTPRNPDIGLCLALAGSKWVIVKIDQRRRVIHVQPSATGVAPPFVGVGGEIHTRIFQRMRQLLAADHIPAFLESHSRELLQRARSSARALGLEERGVLVEGNRIHWLPWLGTKGQRTVTLLAERNNLEVRQDALCLTYNATLDQFTRHLRWIADQRVTAHELADLIDDKTRERFDRYLSARLLDQENVERRLALSEAVDAAASTLMQLERCTQGEAIANRECADVDVCRGARLLGWTKQAAFGAGPQSRS